MTTSSLAPQPPQSRTHRRVRPALLGLFGLLALTLTACSGGGGEAGHTGSHTSEFDLPSFHYWMHRPVDARRADLLAWLEEREYESVSQLRGSMSRHRVAEPAAFERAHYVRTVGTYTLPGVR